MDKNEHKLKPKKVKKTKIVRNEYVKIRRGEEKGYEKGIVEKCKGKPKLFYKFIYGKIKLREKLERLKDGNETYQDPKDMSELLNKIFQQVFTEETEFNQQMTIQKSRCGKLQ